MFINAIRYRPVLFLFSSDLRTSYSMNKIFTPLMWCSLTKKFREKNDAIVSSFLWSLNAIKMIACCRFFPFCFLMIISWNSMFAAAATNSFNVRISIQKCTTHIHKRPIPKPRDARRCVLIMIYFKWHQIEWINLNKCQFNRNHLLFHFRMSDFSFQNSILIGWVSHPFVSVEFCDKKDACALMPYWKNSTKQW